MAIQANTFDAFVAGSRKGTGTANTDGFWSRTFKAMIAARERQAETVVNEHLARFGETELRDMGFDEARIAKIHRK